MRKLETELTFAGFSFPRYIVTLPEQIHSRMPQVDAHAYPSIWRVRCNAVKFNLREHQQLSGTYHAPNPQAKRHVIGFYLEEDNAAGLRIVDSECGSYTDPESDTTINGLVVRLPKSRGFLAGWTMGIGMASNLDAHVFDELTAAERAADNLAESALWEESQYQFRSREADNLRSDIDDKVRELRELRDAVQLNMIARNYSQVDSVKIKRTAAIRESRARARELVDSIRVLRDRYADNFAEF